MRTIRSLRTLLINRFSKCLRNAQPTSHAIDPKQSHARATVSASSSSSKASRQLTMAPSACDSVVAWRAIEDGEDLIGFDHTATEEEIQGASAMKAARRMLG